MKSMDINLSNYLYFLIVIKKKPFKYSYNDADTTY